MRTEKMQINGRDYPLCFSTRVVCRVAERYGDLDGMYRAVQEDDIAKRLEAVTWVLGEMLAAGQRYAQLIGEDAPAPPSADDLLDLFGADDLGAMIQALADTVRAGQTREVEAEPPKNADTTTL